MSKVDDLVAQALFLAESKPFAELIRLARLGEMMESKRFPIQGDIGEKLPSGSVPWEIGMRAYAVWAQTHGRYRRGTQEYQEGEGFV